MKCPTCGFDSLPAMSFCGMCGTRLAIACPVCAFQNPPDYRFCGSCGHSLDGEIDEGIQVEGGLESDRTIGVSPQVVSETLSSSEGGDDSAGPVRLDGERRVASVILADVCGSTDLMEQIGTEAWVRMMNQVFHILESEIYRYGGVVDQFRGDGLVAFFGTTVAHEDDPERAVLASLSMQDAVARYAERLAEEQGIALSLRVGVNTGEVIVARIGDRSQHSEDTAMGEAIALAARMESAAEPGTVLISENTFHLVERQFEWRPLGEIVVKGISKPVTVYRPLSAIRESLRSLRLETSGLSHVFVGRDEQFETIQSRVDDLRRGQGGILSLVADEGMGKSHLVSQARQQVLRDDAILSKSPIPGMAPSVLWLRAQCRSYEQSRPYSMWLDLLTRWLGGQDLSADETWKRLQSEASELWGNRAGEFCPFLARMLSLPVSDADVDAGTGLDGEALRARTFAAIENWVLALSKQSPVVLVFDDLYWADATSVDLLEHCLALCDREPVLFVIMLRSSHSAAMREMYSRIQATFPHRLVSLSLMPLRDEESRELVDGLIGTDVLPEGVCEQIVEKAAGNPYYIEELVRSLVRDELLVRDERTGDWHAAGAIETVDLPDTLRALLAARLDGLEAEERFVLQVAAVVGMVFWENAVRAVVGSQLDLDQSLVALQRVQLIHDRGWVPALGKEYVFHSSLVWELASDSVLSTQRSGYCLQVADHLATLFGQQVLTQYYDVVAYLYRCAGEHRRELFFMLSAAEQAQSIYANVEALEYYGRALELLDLTESQDPRGRTDAWLDWRIESLRGLGTVCFDMGRSVEAEEHLRQALALTKEAGYSVSDTVRLVYWLCETLFWQERYEEQIELAQEGRALLEKGAQTVEMALMNQEIAVGYLALGHRGKFVEFTGQTAQFLDQLSYSQELRPAYSHVISYIRFTHRDAEEGLRWAHLLGDHARAHGDVRAMGQSHQIAGLVYRSSGDLDSAVTEYEQALQKYGEVGDVRDSPRTQRSFVELSVSQGKLEQAREYAEQLVAHQQDLSGKGILMREVRWLLGRVLGAQGDWAGATEALQTALQFQQGSVDADLSAAISFDLGRVCLASGERAQAVEWFDRSVKEVSSTALQGDPLALATALVTIEGAMDDPERFRALCSELEERMGAQSAHQWSLEPVSPRSVQDPVFHTQFTDTLDPGWVWEDPFEDGVLRVREGAQIQAANGRNLWFTNTSAPRLVRQAAGDFVVETTCTHATGRSVAMGGLLMWKGVRDFLRLDYGYAGPQTMLLFGCLDGQDVVWGQGTLGSRDPVRLRLECVEGRVRGLCTLDDTSWFLIGENLVGESGWHVGLYAVGDIDRLAYPGAHKKGTGIRFESFTVWELG